ncbi:DUF1491 family protein [Pelagerythrobacter marinus]|jgi:hypothetical protein|uniref:DUF1491 family protein n=1 Tax=Pelagerythrobacter marinus TaxID=538382 RepID=A0ABW9UXI7_9SPHN|nr:DUF1491 family protein [Pelagerythrobacter marinus]MXO68888.1 DUF1491 family protein [Pelagerythrobacter marinus]USA39189.1 DUF1491 family protein [Pelagerythrobacter marinus]WPZ06724.1 DUF1491 family protein [Pelagerythrobacter marinus]
MEGARLPAHLEAHAILRLAESLGGFASVIEKGERDAGTLLVVTIYRSEPARLFERMPQLDGSRRFVQARIQDTENPEEFWDYLKKRKRQDGDIWILEADIADHARFVAAING